MKETARLKSMVAIAKALTLTIAFSGVALASQPVCPTPETETIKTVTMISCQGMVTETEQVTWESSNEDLINNPPLGDPDEEVWPPERLHEVVGKMDYYQDLKVTDGITNYIKDMDVDTGKVPNLNVMKSVGYTQAGTIGSLSHDERVSFGVVADYAPTEDVILCPFAAAAVWMLPASCEDVEASSNMVVTDVLATTVTKVEISESPLELHYEIDAKGSGALSATKGAAATGHITAEFDVYVEDGSACMCDPGHCAMGRACQHTLGSKLSHYEKSTADGLWEFHKEMDYKSVIRP